MKKNYWLITHWICSACEHEKVYRERVECKPKNTHEFFTYYDWCLG